MGRQLHPVADLFPLLTVPPTSRRTGFGSRSCSTMVAARTAKWIENEPAERQRQGRRDLGANLRKVGQTGPPRTLVPIGTKVRPGDLAKRRQWAVC